MTTELAAEFIGSAEFLYLALTLLTLGAVVYGLARWLHRMAQGWRRDRKP